MLGGEGEEDACVSLFAPVEVRTNALAGWLLARVNTKQPVDKQTLLDYIANVCMLYTT